MRFDDIARFTLGTTVVPEASLEMTATLLIDTLGVAAGAEGMEAGRLARDHAVRFHAAASPKDAATLLFDGRSVSISGAAFALASQIDNLDAHDGYNPTKGHIGCAVVPALCAFAQAKPDLRARDALIALAISYEVAARAGIALHASVSDYHTSGAWNALGVAALACRLNGNSPEVLRHAFGIAEYHGPRSQMMREIANPTMLHDGSGPGALIGSMASLMAADGFTGAPALTVEAPDAAPHWADLERFWTVDQNYIKPYPICRWAHAAIDALAMVMRDYGLHNDQIAHVRVNTFREAAQLYPSMPQTTSQAQYSLPFALAVLLVHGHIGPKHIAGAGLSDAGIEAALGKISVNESPRHSDRFPLGRWSDVDVELTDGTILQSGDIHARGGPEAPMDISEVEEKFMTMCADMEQERAAKIWRMRTTMLDADTKFSELLDLVHPPIEATHV